MRQLTERLVDVRKQVQARRGRRWQSRDEWAADRLLRVLIEARRQLAVDLLNDYESEDEVRLAAGVSWRVLTSWCFAPENGPLVPDDVAETLMREEEQASMRHASKANKRRANAGERLTDNDRAYRALIEEVEFEKREHRSFYGAPYLYGDGNDELDAKVDLMTHWYGDA